MATRRVPKSKLPSASKQGGASRAASFPIVGVGASAGGLEAFTELLKHLPPDTGMAFVLVQHLDPQHKSELAHLLARVTSLPVQEITSTVQAQAGHVYVIAPNTTLGITHGVLTLQPRRKTHTPHRPIDIFFETLAQDQHERAIGVVLSGTATDGTLGLEAIKAEGGITFAQDDSARHDSMPRSAVAAGCVDFVLSPENIAKELARIAKHPYVAGSAPAAASPEDDRASAAAHADDEIPLPSGGRGTPRTAAERARAEVKRGAGKQSASTAENSFKEILVHLRNHSGVDFSLYRSTTIQRRITRRMVLGKHLTLADYAKFLRGNAKELDALYADVLISVTSFFRNPEAFDLLKSTVFPKVLQQRGDDPIRVWVLGCSTGQEAYSIAMAFVESADKAKRMRRLQVFATDLNDALLDKARHGLYAKSLAADIAPERLRRFFVEEEGGYRVSKTLREMVVFARQNLINDPPFSRMDLISCRNLLIYLEPALQRRALPTFHYALKPGGFLFLGASESIGEFTDLFAPTDKKHKIYSKKAAPAAVHHLPLKTRDREIASNSSRQVRPALQVQQGEARGSNGELNAQREADRIALNQFAPPGVLINAELQILQFRGATGAYLKPPSGKPSFDVLKMAREGLMLPLRAAINEAKKQNKIARRDKVQVKPNGKVLTINVQVVPLKNLPEPCFLILFEDAEATARIEESASSKPAPSRPSRTARAGAREEARRIAELESELAEVRNYLESVREQHDASNDALQASHEEVESANEELQSINEELETSKEELESANEELVSINEEMASRNLELQRLNSDLTNLQSSTRLVIVLLGRDLTIRRFSTQAEKQFNLLAGDVGRPIGHIRHNLVFAPPASVPGGVASSISLESFVANVIDSVRENECEVQDQHGRWYSLRARPYLTLDNKVDGAVLVLLDIDALKRSEQAIAAARDYAESTIETVREPLLVLDGELRVESANRSFYRTFRVSAAETIGALIFDLGNRQWNVPQLRTLLEEILPHHASLEDYEVEHEFERLGRRTMLLNARSIDDPVRNAQRILLAIEDISERKGAERRKDEFLAMLAHELRGPLAPLSNMLEIMRHAERDRDLSRRAQDTMKRQLSHMARLIDDLLDASRISRGKLELSMQPIELASVLHQAVEVSRPAMESAGHELTVTLPPRPVYLQADPVRLAQVFSNLLINAAKFTPRQGSISLTADQQSSDVVISVKDTGIGIAPGMLSAIFDLFMQIDHSLERVRGGLGIGLTLVRRLVELHGGSVNAFSEGTDRGSEFVVRLPGVIETPPAPPAKPTEEEIVSGRRILIVDDNHDSAESLALLLSMAGNETRVAFDGLQALEAAAAFRPDVVLLDIGLPKLNGYDVIRRIREQPWGKDMMVVAVTGWGQAEDREKSAEAGFDGHIVKPVDHAALMALVARNSSKKNV